MSKPGEEVTSGRSDEVGREVSADELPPQDDVMRSCDDEMTE
ncbi:MAG: hypothetical protein ACXWCS_15415 [Burkholderiales bacterium]